MYVFVFVWILSVGINELVNCFKGSWISKDSNLVLAYNNNTPCWF